MTVATVSQKGWIVIPADMRKRYNLGPGAKVRIVDYGGVLSIVPVLEHPIEQAAGLLKGKTSLTQALVAEHRAELDHEQ